GIGGGLFVDALWFRELGALVVFRTILVAKIACFAIAFAGCFAVLAAVGLAAVRPGRDHGVGRIVWPAGARPTALPPPLGPSARRGAPACWSSPPCWPR